MVRGESPHSSGDLASVHVVVDAKAIQDEMDRADRVLRGLIGETVDTLTVNSLEAEDAPFLGLIISKLSPMIGNLLERRIIQILDHDSEHGLRWVRQDPGFPDALLVERDGTSTEAGYEVKAWYTLSTELTGRFKESQNLLAPRNVRVVVVAWCMSNIVYGKPLIHDVLTVDGSQIARSRDVKYNKPPGYLTIEPNDTTGRARNLQQTNVSGYKLQEVSAAQLDAANDLVRDHAGRGAAAQTPEAQKMNAALMAQFPYRLDTNFAKIDRIDDVDVESFKANVLSTRTRNRTMAQWARLLRDLNSTSDEVRHGAEKVIQDVYDEL